MLKGFVNINKPLNMTSSDVVVIVRGILRRVTGEKQKVGHLGTLDPMASGVLPIAVGNATRLFDYLQAKTKVYQATFKFTETTDTLDSAGVITQTSSIVPTKDQIIDVIKDYCGDINQIPPIYSAKSVGGKRAYDLARAGIEVELKPKKVHIDSIKLIDDVDGIVHLQSGDIALQPNEYAFEIVCGGGTYIRAIARDIAEKLGTVGYMSSLNRIKTGDFCIENAISIKDFEQNPLDNILNVDCGLSMYERYELPYESSQKVLNGVKLSFENMPKDDFVITLNGEIMGIAHNERGLLHIKTRL